MTDADLSALEAAARAATPGPWFRPIANDTAIRSDDVDIAQTVGAYELEWERMEADAAYIAKANPDATLRLIQRVREAEADAARFRWLDDTASYYGSGDDLRIEWRGSGSSIRAAIDALTPPRD
jgi:hypothetical protein